MVILIFLSVIALVGLALHFMQEAVTQQEFSLMIAGTLVAASAAGLVGASFLIGHSFDDLAHLQRQEVAIEQAYDSIRWYVETEAQAQEPNSVYLSDSSATR
jgi:K+-transporting ATPase c subunit